MNSLKLLRVITNNRIISALNYSNESFLTGTSSQYIEDMYNAWLKDPSTVHVSWDSYFRNSQYHSPPNLAPVQRNEIPLSQYQPSSASGPSVAGAGLSQSEINDHLAVQALIRRYQAYGHLLAHVDPLGITQEDKSAFHNFMHEAYNIEKLNLDKNRLFTLPPFTFIGGKETQISLKEIVQRLENAYCKHIGVEYIYLESSEERNFIRERLEKPGALEISDHQKRLCLARLTKACEFELFLARKWSSVKRFGLEGCEMLIPGMKQIIDKSTHNGVEHFFMGLAHRGRLNLLANVCRKPLYQLFTQFAGLKAADEGSGDMKYHLGTHIKRVNKFNGKEIKLTLLSNPSHLEAVAPLVIGRTKAEMFYQGDTDGKRSLAILIHGDASFCGQGVVYESLHMSCLPCYTTHGLIHIIINNQIGFTTDPRSSRSSPYCSDVGKVVNAPIFHVNADQPEAVIHVCNIAAEWRAKFHKDIVIDLVGYRRNGHNEADEPMFTQPIMYSVIRKHKPILDLYSQRLIEEKVVTTQEFHDTKKDFIKTCEDHFEKANNEKHIHFKDWLDSPWSGFFEGKNQLEAKPTGIPEATLKHIGEKFSSPPPPAMNFLLHKGIERILKLRMDMVKSRKIDWALGEAMAYGSLLKDRVHVRLSGEDVERGTFSHRHHVLHHQTVDKGTYVPLANLYPDQATYTVCNSSLSEYGVLGFEVGYAQTNPNALVMWEAQFGDFCNTAQCIIDQFLAAGQAKWVRQNGIVLLLPHAMEGMGPEHSCARPERFLQMSAEDPDSFPPEGPNFAMQQLHDINWIVADLTTPANLFHILRRQIALPFRKPLIIMSPKSLLRHPEARSSFDEMLEGTEFKRVIPDDGLASKSPAEVKKLIFCSGKVYFDIKAERDAKNVEKSIAITRIEQLCPFPFDLIKKEYEKYPNAKIFFCQEEPKNYGFYAYVQPRFLACLKGSRPVGYIGRPVSASPATGSKAQHDSEVLNILNDTVSL